MPKGKGKSKGKGKGKEKEKDEDVTEMAVKIPAGNVVSIASYLHVKQLTNCCTVQPTMQEVRWWSMPHCSRPQGATHEVLHSAQHNEGQMRAP
jgi:hypothetical protein